MQFLWSRLFRFLVINLIFCFDKHLTALLSFLLYLCIWDFILHQLIHFRRYAHHILTGNFKLFSHVFCSIRSLIAVALWYHFGPVVLAQHAHYICIIRVKRTHYLCLLNFVIDHQLARVPLCNEAELLVGYQILHIDVPWLTQGTVKFTLDEILLETLLTGRKRPAAFCQTSFIN